MMVKLSLVAAFVMTMATLTFAASALPAPDAGIVAPEAVASVGAVRTADSAFRTFAMPTDVVPATAADLMASL